ncbi:C99L2 protein, partial [Alca torda]|nr:C99L2 protein [Alca torda]
FDDSDLSDGSLPKGGGGGSGSNGKIVVKNLHKPLFSVSDGAIAGIISAVFATVVGAVSSFIAYQKKKLCFKQSGKNS